VQDILIIIFDFVYKLKLNSLFHEAVLSHVHGLMLQKRLMDKKAEKATLINKIDVKKNRFFICF